MNDIIEALKNSPEYIGGSGRTDAEIETAEQQLGVRFATDYRHYLKEIGLASFDGHELTGLSKSARLNVVDVTVAQREWTPEASSWYVVEETYIDGIVIWQSSEGAVYRTVPGVRARKIFDSLTEYIKGYLMA